MSKSLAMKSAIVAATATVLMAGAPSAAAASGDAAGSAPGYLAFRNYLTNECIDTYASGALTMEPCDEYARGQEWHWIRSSHSDTYRLLRNRWTGKCMEGFGSEAQVKSDDCDKFGGWTPMLWRYRSLGGGVYRLQNMSTGDYAVPGPGDRVYQNHFLLPNTKWYMTDRA